MFEKIEIFIKRHDELSKMLYDPSVACDNDRYTAIMKELHSIERTMSKVRAASSMGGSPGRSFL